MFAGLSVLAWGGISALVVILGLTAGLMYYRGNAISEGARADSIQVQYDIVKKVNDNNEQTMNRILDQQRIDNSAIGKLNTKLDEISQATALANAQIRELDLNDEPSKTYLDQPVPDALRGVLNGKSQHDRPN